MIKHAVIIGLHFGDEGKGKMVQFYTDRIGATVNVRFNGGPQASHTVRTDFGGEPSLFAQIGAGSWNHEVHTFLLNSMVVDPIALLEEVDHHESRGMSALIPRLHVDPECTLVLPYHRFTNQMVALGQTPKHGTVGTGTGFAIADRETDAERLTFRDLMNQRTLEQKLLKVLPVYNQKIKDAHAAATRIVASSTQVQQADMVLNFYYVSRDTLYRDLLEAGRRLSLTLQERTKQLEAIQGRFSVWEGAQGTLLDPEFGFPPHITRGRVRIDDAVPLIRDREQTRVIGVLRAYAHRHGSGPLPTEDNDKFANIDELTNGDNLWQGPFRRGPFDGFLARYALHQNPVDFVALTCLDQVKDISGPLTVSNGYELFGGGRLTSPEQLASDRKNITEVIPERSTLDKWDVDISRRGTMDELPVEAENYCAYLNRTFLDGSLGVVSVGPTRSQTIVTNMRAVQ